MMSDDTVRVLVDSVGHAIGGSYDDYEGSDFSLTCPYGQTVEPDNNIWYWTDVVYDVPAGYETLEFSYAVKDWSWDEEVDRANYRCVMSVNGSDIIGDLFIIAGDTSYTFDSW